MRTMSFAALLMAFTPLAAADDLCVTGPDTTVDDVVIIFQGSCTPPAEIRAFNRRGTYKNVVFPYPATSRPFKYPFAPGVIMMSADIARDCTAGNIQVEKDGRCVAHYVFHCAERRYQLRVTSNPPAPYAIQRALEASGRPGVICAQPIGPPAPQVGALPAGERVIVSLYGAEDEKLPLVALPPIDLASAPAKGASATYNADDLRRLMAETVRGQGGGGPSPNAEGIAKRQKRNVLTSVTVSAKPIEVR